MKTAKTLLGILREKIFSPSRVQDDAAILRLAARRVRQKGLPVRILKPQDLTQAVEPSMAFAMCEGPRCLKILEQWEQAGYPVLNSPRAVANCHRWKMLSLLEGTEIPIPKFLFVDPTTQIRKEFDLDKGVWIKRWDVQSTRTRDVRFLYDGESLEKVLAELWTRGIKKAILQEHIPGTPLKFYGVRATKWFVLFPRGGARSLANHADWKRKIRRTCEETAERLGLEIYGGDLIVTEDRYYLVDINSWPSFAPCRERAAQEIAKLVERRYRSWQRV